MIARSAHRFTRFSLFAALAILLLLNATVRAQAVPQADIENSEFKAVGRINSNDVYVRSGASENDYPTTKLGRDAQVTVVGEKFNWLKILPPDGTFCYVAKAYVNRAGNGSVGVATNTLNVRIGSSLNQLKTKVTNRPLELNERVEIIGEQDEYFKIKPPADVFLYVNKQYVELIRVIRPEVAGNAGNGAAPAPQGGAEKPTGPGAIAKNDPTNELQKETPKNSGNDSGSATPATKNSDEVAAAPATQSTESAEAEYERLEALYDQVTQRPLDEQPIEELLAGYQKLATNDGLAESLRRVAEFKVKVLTNRMEDKKSFAEVKKIQEDLKQKQMALKAEQGELEKRVADANVKFFTAVGTLRTSSLQGGQQIVYRLTDPANGRTVIYIRSNDEKLSQMLGGFIGVKGEIENDRFLNVRIITPTTFEVVNPSSIGQNVAAQICPPSLLPSGTGTASSN